MGLSLIPDFLCGRSDRDFQRVVHVNAANILLHRMRQEFRHVGLQSGPTDLQFSYLDDFIIPGRLVFTLLANLQAIMRCNLLLICMYQVPGLPR